MWHPYQKFITNYSSKPLVIAGLLTMLCMLTLGRVNDGLQIVNLELVGNLKGANEIMGNWSSTERAWAIFGTGFDYLFLLAYGLFLSLASVRLASKIGQQFFKNIGYLLSSLMLLAAILDAIENYALLQIMLDQGTEFPIKLARYCAIPKFLIVISTMLYITFTAIILSLKRLKEHAPTH